MSIGDVNSNEKGSGARYNEGKADFSLIPLCTMEDEAKVWAYGKKKYAAWNWCKGMDWDVPFSCLMRHMAKWQAGEENDVESGLPHLAHAMCNLRMLTLFAKTYKEGDTRPTKWLEDWFKPEEVKEVPTLPSLPTMLGIPDAGYLPPIGLHTNGLSWRSGDEIFLSPKPLSGLVDGTVGSGLIHFTPDTHGWTANATNKTK